MVVQKCITASGEEAVLFELTWEILFVERFKSQHIGYQVNICLFQYDMFYSVSSAEAINRRFSLKVVFFVFLNVLLLLSRLQILPSFPFTVFVFYYSNQGFIIWTKCVWWEF